VTAVIADTPLTTFSEYGRVIDLIDHDQAVIKVVDAAGIPLTAEGSLLRLNYQAMLQPLVSPSQEELLWYPRSGLTEAHRKSGRYPRRSFKIGQRVRFNRTCGLDVYSCTCCTHAGTWCFEEEVMPAQGQLIKVKTYGLFVWSPEDNAYVEVARGSITRLTAILPRLPNRPDPAYDPYTVEEDPHFCVLRITRKKQEETWRPSHEPRLEPCRYPMTVLNSIRAALGLPRLSLFNCGHDHRDDLFRIKARL
jgi:hypothetical protein